MKFFLWIDGKQDGPFEPEQIRAMLGEGSIAAVTLACPEDGTGEWKPISSYEEIVEPPQRSEPTPDPTPAPAPGPPVKKPKFRWKPIAAFFAGVAVIWVVVSIYQNHKLWRDFHPTQATLQTKGENEIRKDLSNNVVGITRIVKVRVAFVDSAWRGMATYEFVNKVGGVERGRKMYLFHAMTDSDGVVWDIIAREDPDQVELERMAADGIQGASDILKKEASSSP
jgi:hypothetical protein